MADKNQELTEKLSSVPARSLMPPYLVLRDFLDEETVAGLLDYAQAHQSDFAPTKLGAKAVNPSYRVSVGLRDLGQYREVLKNKIFELLPRLIAELRVTPVESPKLETQLVAHGDGAFYKQHIDTQTARYDDVSQIRVLSGVYYFHAEPKAFEGGALRLFAIGADPAPYIDIEPARNSFLVFPSWAPHEVRPVICPSHQFMDSRFAINCWIHRAKHAVSGDTAGAAG
jgi:SM-20-related protein